jgi:hypothetical protein
LGDQRSEKRLKPVKLNFDEEKPQRITFSGVLDSAEGDMSPVDRKIFFEQSFTIFFRIVFWLRICRPLRGFVEFAKLRLRFFGILQIRVATVTTNLNSNS